MEKANELYMDYLQLTGFLAALKKESKIKIDDSMLYHLESCVAHLYSNAIANNQK